MICNYQVKSIQKKQEKLILTENISFIDNNILNRCQIIPIERPTKKTYETTLNVTINKNLHNITCSLDLYTKGKNFFQFF